MAALLLSSGDVLKLRLTQRGGRSGLDNVRNALPVTFEANAPTMRTKRLAMFPSWLALEDVRLARSLGSRKSQVISSKPVCGPWRGRLEPVAATAYGWERNCKWRGDERDGIRTSSVEWRSSAKRCENIVALSEELGVHRRLLYKWRDQLDPVDIGDEPLPENPRESTLGKEVSQLKRLLAERLWSWIFSKVPCKK
jgi:hypothetical protein